MKSDRLEVDIITPATPEVLLREIREALTSSPREIHARYFYDDHGSRLFEKITELPEYYQTRTEEKILRTIAHRLIEQTGAEELIELGSGAATKTRILLDAMRDAKKLRRYVPFDVSEGIVRRVGGELLEEYPGLSIHAVIADFTRHLDGIPEGRNRLCIFLGGTIGNFKPDLAVRFLNELEEELSPGDHFLLGTDLIKDVRILEAAYNDSKGVTAEFNRNSLNVLNRFLDSDFDPGSFEHHAFYNRDEDRIEMWLRSVKEQRVELPKIDLELALDRGEEIRTEISRKFSRGKVESLLNATGFELENFWTDPDELFALSLARRL